MELLRGGELIPVWYVKDRNGSELCQGVYMFVQQTVSLASTVTHSGWGLLLSVYSGLAEVQVQTGGKGACSTSNVPS